ncbi:MAG: DUF2141 domain-containing protein [Bacteroidetes bacterium]|nr:MAG: DUF2141 domain-containing protein [Bacteroidota bacterium]
MLKRYFHILFLFFFVIILHGLIPAQTYSLKVVIEGVQEVQGKIQMGLFNDAGDFLETGSEFRVVSIAIDTTTMIFNFQSLPAGKYAISLYHDLDASGDIEKNFIGFPLEPFGISNDAWNRFSAPRWKEASFHVRADTTIVIHLKH